MRILNIVTSEGWNRKIRNSKNLAFGLAKKGLKTLIVDLDPQANTSSTILKLHESISKNT